MQKNKLKEKLLQGVPAIGSFLRMDSISAEIMGRTGWDYVIIDVEHGVHTMEDVSNMIRASRAAGITSVVRVPGTAPINIQRALDAGADGVQIPQLTSLAEIEAAVAAARYYPRGNRGACAYSAATGYSTVPFPEHIATSNDEVLVVVHAENAWSADNIEDIVKIPGIDVVFCGPWDMSQSLGIPGQTADERVTSRISHVIEVCKAASIAVGMFVQHPEQAEEWIRRGVTYMSCSVDVGIYAEACTEYARGLRVAIEKAKQSRK